MSKEAAKVHYRITPVDPGGQVFEVSCVIAKPDPAGQRLSLPSWIPGSYLVRDFAGSILSLDAKCDGKPVTVSKTAKSAWQCEPCSGALSVHYKVLANDFTVRGAHLDMNHGFFNGTSVFLRVEGMDDARCTVRVERNPHERFKDWHLATSMQRLDAEPHGFGVYQAQNYDELIDHPFEMGTFQTQFYEAHGVPHQLVVTGLHHGDLSRVARDLKAICEQQMEFFGLPAPIDRYVFLLTVMGKGYGGLEHRWSSSLMASRDDLPGYDEEKVSDSYRAFLGLCSHEYFHLWNVKRIRPAPVAESDLRSEAYTRQLWIFEGVTSYYDDLFLVRSNAIEESSYLQLIENTATRVLSGSGRLEQSLSDASFDAWIKFYKRDDNAPNTQVSYYTKGALAALGLDLLIRSRSQGEKSLDQIMRHVWEHHGQKDIPLAEGQFEQIAADVSGMDLQDYFDKVIRGVEDPPLADLFKEFGLSFKMHALADGETQPQRSAADLPDRPAMHVGLRNAIDRVFLTTIFTHGPAHRAGLCSGDELVAINGMRITPASYKEILGRYRAGDTIEVDVFRR
ncbi:MAG: peptidase M61, partial [Gammaproteobacteria bacterium]|nr:peptidase M61 [Gammaproteobacteria bacterium]